MRKKANKCYIIHATDNILPDITLTPIFADYEENPSDFMRCIYCLYLALSKRENYYQFNSPTAFGDTEYARYAGIVCGILQTTGWEESKTKDGIIVKNGNEENLIIDRIKKPESYHEEQREIAEMLQNI